MHKEFIWFMGVVENIHDPKEAGRVQVRCFGYHTYDTDKVPTEGLPWATVMGPTTSSSFRGINNPLHGLMIGSTVFGFFLDGTDAQYPMILGSVPGSAPAKKPNVATTYAVDEQLDNYVPGEGDVGTLAQSGAPTTVTGKSFIDTLTSAIVTKVHTATPPELSTVDGTGYSSSFYDVKKYDVPPPRGGSNTAEYAQNRVTMSTSGHVTEIDDTPGNERLMTYHNSGTYQEFDAHGNIVTRVVGDKFDVVIGNDNIYVKGKCNITVEGDCRQLVVGNYHLEVYGDYTEKIHGSRKVKVTGNDLKEVTGYQSTLIDADRRDTINGMFRTNVGNSWRQYVAGDYDITVGGLAPAFSVAVNGLPGIGLIDLTCTGTVDIYGELGAGLKTSPSTGVITIGGPTTTSPILIQTLGAISIGLPATAATVLNGQTILSSAVVNNVTIGANTSSYGSTNNIFTGGASVITADAIGLTQVGAKISLN